MASGAGRPVAGRAFPVAGRRDRAAAARRRRGRPPSGGRFRRSDRSDRFCRYRRRRSPAAVRGRAASVRSRRRRPPAPRSRRPASVRADPSPAPTAAGADQIDAGALQHVRRSGGPAPAGRRNTGDDDGSATAAANAGASSRCGSASTRPGIAKRICLTSCTAGSASSMRSTLATWSISRAMAGQKVRRCPATQAGVDLRARILQQFTGRIGGGGTGAAHFERGDRRQRIVADRRRRSVANSVMPLDAVPRPARHRGRGQNRSSSSSEALRAASSSSRSSQRRSSAAGAGMSISHSRLGDAAQAGEFFP